MANIDVIRKQADRMVTTCKIIANQRAREERREQKEWSKALKDARGALLAIGAEIEAMGGNPHMRAPLATLEGRKRELETLIHGIKAGKVLEGARLTIGKGEWRIDRDAYTAPGMVCVVRWSVRGADFFPRDLTSGGIVSAKDGKIEVRGHSCKARAEIIGRGKNGLVMVKESRYWSLTDLVNNIQNPQTGNKIDNRKAFEDLFTLEERPHFVRDLEELIKADKPEMKETQKRLKELSEKEGELWTAFDTGRKEGAPEKALRAIFAEYTLCIGSMVDLAERLRAVSKRTRAILYRRARHNASVTA